MSGRSGGPPAIGQDAEDAAPEAVAATARLGERWGVGLARFRPRPSRPRPSPSRRGRAAVSHRFSQAVAEALDRGQGLVWAVLPFGLGIALYFHLPAEPSVIVLGLLAGLLTGLSLWLRRAGQAPAGLIIAALLLAGMTAAGVRTRAVEAPRLDRPRTVELAGFIEHVDRTARGYRLVLRVVSAGGLDAAARPARVRVSLRGEVKAPGVGAAVRLRARLMPPPRATMPGGYDFSFRAFFDGIGATGFVFGAVRPADLGAVPADLRLHAAIASLRAAVTRRIVEALGPGTASGLAAALIVGDRSGIPEPVTDALRTAGLAHILAISGLHMALFAGSVFFVIRAGLALSMRLSQSHPIDIWAAWGALFAASFYLVLSGASVATQRAYVMIVLVLAGRLLGRRSLTLRSVAIAAFAILLVTPEALLEPGFQMSFAAVVALITAYEEITRRRLARQRERHEEPQGGGIRQALLWGVKWLGAIFLTSLIAGVATGAIGVQHFHRIAPLGPLINLLAMPIVTALVMPMAVLALALLPLGLEVVPLTIMGAAIDQVVALALWAQESTPGEGTVGAPSAAATLLIVLAGLVACLAPKGYRRACLLPLAAALVLYLQYQPPDLLISDDGKSLALRDRNGTLHVTMRPTGFLGEVWLRAEGIPEAERRRRRVPKSAMSCDPTGCILLAYGPVGEVEEVGARARAGQAAPRAGMAHGPPTGGPLNTASPTSGLEHTASASSAPGSRQAGAHHSATSVPAGVAPAGHRPAQEVLAAQSHAATRSPPLIIALVRRADAFADDCQRADIIVTRLQAPEDCAARQVFDADRLRRSGTVALRLTADGAGGTDLNLTPSYRWQRPWNRTTEPGEAR
ncbi:ComEC/Rec2 family competence protein [Stappia indica]|uniref:ComEC/Rec2 family competence protein n=1 Tax=Stappia indica TaxID=538381 RepID=UPI001CD46BDC|nr:ComEC/Rec2 family competence protein [Stappia indica]MCA1297098.1 ComEC family competence protein [Stappia indica]